jgi:hypothetical protein
MCLRTITCWFALLRCILSKASISITYRGLMVLPDTSMPHYKKQYNNPPSHYFLMHILLPQNKVYRLRLIIMYQDSSAPIVDELTRPVAGTRTTLDQ